MQYLDLFPETTTVQFDSVTDMANFITESRRKKNWRILRHDANDWNNNCDFDKAYDQMVFGYKDFSQEMVDDLNDFTDSEVLDRGGLSMDVEGSAYDMGAVLSGIPECCISDTSIEEKKHLRLVVSVGFSAGVDSKYILNRGVAIANLAGTLMMKGYVVDLDFLMQYNSYGHGKSVFFVRVPASNLCASTISFFASPQFLRKICIGVSDFILDRDINGNATGFKSSEVLSWCRKNSLYFDDGYDIDDNDQIEEMYRTPDIARKSVLEQYNNWLKSKNC